MHPCIELYKIAGNGVERGQKAGICRITGEHSKGLLFTKWVADTFTNYGDLHYGQIISNEALFSFEEASLLLQEKTNRDKPQRFRTYSHIITNSGEWFAFTKANKKEIVELILSNSIKILCLTDTGQKHIFFKHRIGFWQLDDEFICPNVNDFAFLHSTMLEMLLLGFGQEQVKTGNYNQIQIIKVGIENWQKIENKLKLRRGEPIFNLAAWLMFVNKNVEL